MIFLYNDVTPVLKDKLESKKHKTMVYSGKIEKAEDMTRMLSANDTLITHSITSVINSAEKIIKFLFFCTSQKINLFFEDTETNIFGTETLLFEELENHEKMVSPELLNEYYEKVFPRPLRSQLTKYHQKIVRALEEGMTCSALAKKLNVNYCTLTTYVRKMDGGKPKKARTKTFEYLDTKRDQLEQMLEKGTYKRQEIADELDCTLVLLRQYLKAHHLDKKYPRKRSDTFKYFLKHESEIRTLLAKNVSLSDIADKYDMSYGSLHTFMKKSSSQKQYIGGHDYLDKNYNTIRDLLKKGEPKSVVYKKLRITPARLDRFLATHPELKKLVRSRKRGRS